MISRISSHLHLFEDLVQSFPMILLLLSQVSILTATVVADISSESYQRVFKDLPQVIMKMLSLVVFYGQDVAKGVQVGYVHENSLEDRFTTFMFDSFLLQTH